MNIQNNVSFKGYDAIPLKALYMQGIKKPGEINIFREMKSIAQKEGIDLFLNQDGREISKNYAKRTMHSRPITIWGQDKKAFIKNGNEKRVLWSANEPLMSTSDLGELNDFNIESKNYIPRGGEYYLGYDNSDEKWMIINSQTISNKKSEGKNDNMPTVSQLLDLFDIKSEKLYILSFQNDDLDECIRPIGFPYVLVNDYNECLKNLELIKQEFPKSSEPYSEMKKFLAQKLKEENLPYMHSCEDNCKKLKEFGFKPIKIGGRYLDDINYMNAIAMQNKSGNISYITNSTRKSYPELEFLEKLFKEQLKEKIPKIENIYFVSGGKRADKKGFLDSLSFLYEKGLKRRNTIMDILANRLGGIHCMTAEIPDFTKVENH